MKHRQYLGPAESAGFTVIELITVLLLLGILSAFSVSKLASPSSFGPSMATQESIALMRFALSQSQARQDLTISFVLDQQGEDWRFRVIADRSGVASVIRSTLVQHKNVGIQIVNGVSTIDLDSSTALTLDLGGLGSIANGTAGVTVLDPGLGIEVSITGAGTFNLCIGSSGYTYRGVCV